VARAQHWARSAPLPQPGSFQDNLLIELSNREKNLDFARLYVVADLVRSSLGADDSRLAALLDLYEAELHHDTYDPSFIARKRAEIQARTAAVRAKIAEVERKKREAAAVVEAMTVTEEDLKPPG
jgi:hypothetical protein